jgi:hypothetical protein
MSLVARKPRPLSRDTGSLRDDRLFIVACDDTYAPKQYFGFFRLTRVQVHVFSTEGRSPAAKHVLDRLLSVEHDSDDELWMLLDTDHYIDGSHRASFIQAIQEAKQRGVNVALSRPCFELWLLLHYVAGDAVTGLPNAAHVGAELRRILGAYNKVNLNAAHYPIAFVADACRRAETLDLTVPGGDIPDANATRVYLLWKAIAAKALPSQLPLELRALL